MVSKNMSIPVMRFELDYFLLLGKIITNRELITVPVSDNLAAIFLGPSI